MKEEQSPFTNTAQEYFDKGWSPVPVPYRKKANPPAGYTGRAATKSVDQKTIDGWLGRKRPYNIAIIMPDDMIGIDVDNYGDHGGAATLAKLEEVHGKLPPAPLVTSRDDGISGIRFFRVPSGLAWSGKYGPGIDIVQSGHRYAVVWPSIHPEDRVYRWQDGEVPTTKSINDLPRSLVEELSQGTAGEVLAASSISTEEANHWLNELPGGGLCWETYGAIDRIRDHIGSNRHDTMKSGQWELVKLGTEGHRGIRRALAELRDLFFENVLGDAERESVAGHEFFSALNTAIKKNYEVERIDPCECGVVPDLLDSSTPPIEPRKKKNKDPVVTPASQFKSRATIWLWGPSKYKRDQDPFVPLGELVLLAGAENLGKSTLAIDMAANLSRGTMRGKYHGSPKSVFISTTEDSWEHTIKPRLDAARADLDRVFRIESHDNGVLTLPNDIGGLERMINEYDVAMYILDPLNSTIDSRLDTHKDSDVRRALEPLVSVAHRANCTLVGLIHKNKSDTKDPNKSIMGSRAYVAVARTVLYVEMHPEEKDVRVLGIPKNNLGKTNPESLTFTIVEKQVGWDEEADEPITASKLEWTGKTDLNIKEVMEAGNKPTRMVGHPAREWLQDFLQEQARCVPSSEVRAAAKEAGISDNQLRSAREALGIEVSRTKTIPSKTCWQDAAASLLDSMVDEEDL